jgi:hypothetical protein
VVMCACVCVCVCVCVCGVWRGVLDKSECGIVWRGVLWRLFVVMRQHNVWCVCVCVALCVERCAGLQCAWCCVWRGVLWRLSVVMLQHNVWCVCAVFCVERCAVEVICGNAAACGGLPFQFVSIRVKVRMIHIQDQNKW